MCCLFLRSEVESFLCYMRCFFLLFCFVNASHLVEVGTDVVHVLFEMWLFAVLFFQSFFVMLFFIRIWLFFLVYHLDFLFSFSYDVSFFCLVQNLVDRITQNQPNVL